MAAGQSKQKRAQEVARLHKLIDKGDHAKIKRRADEARDKKDHEEQVRLGPRNRLKKLLASFIVEELGRRGKSLRMPPDVFLVRLEEVAKPICKTYDLEPPSKKEKEEKEE